MGIFISYKRYEELSTSAALRSERITCQLRNLVFTISSSGKSDYLKQAADVQGIQISSSEQILTITLPGLLPKRKVRTNTASGRCKECRRKYQQRKLKEMSCSGQICRYCGRHPQRNRICTVRTGCQRYCS